jgi:Concanavalin A-like lectin/glucanases superfamily/Secretion system C-terminal sorting domain
MKNTYLIAALIIFGSTLSAQINLDSGLVAYYPFNGNANDESGNGNNGSVSGATLTTDRFGNDSSAYSFNGTDNYIGYPVLWSSSPDSITLVAWFNIASSQSDGKILYHGDNGEFQLFVGGDTSWAGVHLGQNVTDPWYYVREFSTLNEWRMMAAIWSRGQSFRLYLNRVLVDSVSVSLDELLDPGPGYQPSIGSYGRTLGAYFDGMIDDIRIYNRVLTKQEIDSLYGNYATSIDIPLNTTSKNIELYQNFPNPFNPTTNVEFSIPKSEFVTLKVYNILGEEVTTLVSERLPAGSHKYDWPARSSGGDAGSLASGVYLYRIQAGKYSEVRKMVFMK